MADIIRVAQLFPRFLEQEEERELIREVTMEESKATLKWFKKDKSLGPDGWTIEFYLAFFDIIGTDLLHVIEDSRISGRIEASITSTFIVLIPKANNPSSFYEYHPISLCNCIYKIIAKIISNQMRPILSKHISLEQFAFLQDRQIYEVVGTAQKVLHTLHTRKCKCMVLKVDLSKSFDRVNWLYIRMLLTHLGFPFTYIKWIMSCITNIPFSVLVNGSASPFFLSERGLRQGYPLSLLLFLLAMERLSRMIKDEHRRGRLQGIKITDDCRLTHLLFVDDVLIFLNGSIATAYTQHQIQFALHCFRFTQLGLVEGLKYLGYKLKPLSYKIADWTWLIAKMDKRLNIWIQALCCRFLWKGSQPGKIFAQVKWDALILPKKWGGWGLKKLDDFSIALATKVGWYPITTDSLWSRVTTSRYIAPLHILDWIRRPIRSTSGISTIWKAVIKALDPIKHIQEQNVSQIAHIADGENSTFLHQAWKSAHQLNIPPHWHQLWEDYTQAISEAHIRITDGDDEIIWALSKSGRFSPKDGYLVLPKARKP
eukprot:PITA_35638